MGNSICAISAPFPGVTQVLKHGQRLGMWDLIILDKPSEIPSAPVYLLGAWHPAYDHLVQKLPASSKIAVLWTSSSGEVGFEPVEMEFIKHIMESDRIAAVWFGQPALAAALRGKSFYAPYPVDILGMPTQPVIPLEREGTMTLFAPQTLKKNAFGNMVAASLIQSVQALTLETNMDVPDVLRPNLRARHYDWLPEEHYRPLLAASSLNLCASWAETLNYQSIEAAMLGVPSVGSHTIPWLPAYAQASPDDPRTIARVGLRTIGAGNEHKGAAIAWAENANSILRGMIESRLLSLI